MELKEESILTLSSCEAEYVAASYAACEAAWIKMLIEKLKVMEPEKMKMFVDNKSVIDLTNHLVCHG